MDTDFLRPGKIDQGVTPTLFQTNKEQIKNQGTMEKNPLPFIYDTPAEWLENLFDRASIFMAMQSRENLRIVANEIFEAYLWLVETNNPMAFEFSPLMSTIDRGLSVIIFD